MGTILFLLDSAGRPGPEGTLISGMQTVAGALGTGPSRCWGMGGAWGTPSTSGSGSFVVRSSLMRVVCVSFGGNLSPHHVPTSTAGSGSVAGRERAGSACHECGPLSPLIITFLRTKDQAGAGRQRALARWGTGCRRAPLAGVGFMGSIWGPLMQTNVLLGCLRHTTGTQYAPTLGAATLTSR